MEKRREREQRHDGGEFVQEQEGRDVGDGGVDEGREVPVEGAGETGG